MKMQYIIFHLSEYITIGHVEYYLNNTIITKHDNSLKHTLSGPKHERTDLKAFLNLNSI